MQVCPHCNRKLISHASARCNWCGQIIDDPNYQAQAAVNREAYLVEQAMHEANRLAAFNAGLTSSPLSDPLLGPFMQSSPLVSRQYAVDEARRAAARAKRMAPPLSPPSPAFPPEPPLEYQSPPTYQSQPEPPQQQPFVDYLATPSNKNQIQDLPSDEPDGNRFGHLEL